MTANIGADANRGDVILLQVAAQQLER